MVDELVRAAGFRTKRNYVATSRGSRRGDLEIRDAHIADKAHLILDVSMVHEFHGACDDIGRNGALRHAPNPDRVLIDAAKRKVGKYRLDYLQDGKAFLPLIASTSGRLHGEFVRLLCPWRRRRPTASAGAAPRPGVGGRGPTHAGSPPQLLAALQGAYLPRTRKRAKRNVRERQLRFRFTLAPAW